MVIDFKVYCMHAYQFVFKSNSLYILVYRKALLTLLHMKKLALFSKSVFGNGSSSRAIFFGDVLIK